MLEALALRSVGIAGDIPENTSILPQGYVEPSEGETEAFQDSNHSRS